jgi:hypothetical protein
MEAARRLSGELEMNLAMHSGEEMVAALGLSAAPAFVRNLACSAFSFASVPLGRVLARFDLRIAQEGLARASAGALEELGAVWSREGAAPPTGPLLVVANHPGAYDALVLFAALGRRDVAVVAADRRFLRALPELSRHLILLPDLHRSPIAAQAGRGFGGGTRVRSTRSGLSRATAVRRALRHLLMGGALLHFGAGRIEPDPAFLLAGGGPALGAWTAGTGLLVRGAARAGGAVVAAVAQRVHSERAKRLVVTRIAERYGVSTLAPLLQVAVRAYRDVRPEVRFSAPAEAACLASALSDGEIADRVRAMAMRLIEQRTHP